MKIIVGLICMCLILWMFRDLAALGLPGVIALVLLALLLSPSAAKS